MPQADGVAAQLSRLLGSVDLACDFQVEAGVEHFHGQVLCEAE